MRSKKSTNRKIHYVFTQEVIKIALISNNDKRIQSIYSIEANAYGTSKDITR